jgi:endogenous inhibitor of DNA gyrase (YacG/DUF329 family)
MEAPVRARCPTCRRPIGTGAATRPRDYPFCSERCRLVDLHKWLSGEYRVPWRPAEPGEGPREDGEGEGSGEGGA